jgi:hypothetical protein
MNPLYFRTDPTAGILFCRRSAYGDQRVAHIPYDMSLDSDEQQLLADVWLMSDAWPEPLPLLNVRRIITQQRAEIRLGDAIKGLFSKVPVNG